MTISVDLAPALEKLVDDLVDAGRYASRTEVLSAGLRLVQDREAKLTALKADLQIGLDELDAGLALDADEVFDELEAKLAAVIQAAE